LRLEDEVVRAEVHVLGVEASCDVTCEKELRPSRSEYFGLQPGTSRLALSMVAKKCIPL